MKLFLIFLLFMAINNFLIFAYDIEYDKDFMTWIWLLSSIIYFIWFLTSYIKDLIKQK
jgi:hypothetical protein